MSGLKYVFLAICLFAPLDAKTLATDIKPTKDSYLAALIASKATKLAYNKNRREDVTYPVYNVPASASGTSSSSSSETNQNSPSGYDYKPPATNYGTPVVDTYSPPPSASYGGPYHRPPPPSYGPPAYQAPIYIPAPPANYVPYGPPVMEEHSKGVSIEKWLLDKIKFKVDFYTIGKILLKLVIFKKIVKFVALICLLLFVPTLKKKLGMGDKDHGSNEDSEDDSEEERLLKNANTSHISARKLDDLTLMLTRAIETFAVQNIGCDDDDSRLQCKFSNIYNRLFSVETSESVSVSEEGESKESTKNATNNEVNEV